jgi:hypothetical protein
MGWGILKGNERILKHYFKCLKVLTSHNPISFTVFQTIRYCINAAAAAIAAFVFAATHDANYKKAIIEKEDTKKKIKQAELLHDVIRILKASNSTVSLKELMELRNEIKNLESSISKSAALQCKLENLERQISEMSSSRNCINLLGQHHLQEAIKDATDKHAKAIAIKAKVSEIERNPAFLQLSDIEQLMDRLGTVNSIFHNKSLQGPLLEAELDAILKVQNEAKDELECIVCLEVPLQGIKVFSCLEHHLLCSDCAKRILQSCPVCRQNFTKTPPTRNRLAEKMIQHLS